MTGPHLDLGADPGCRGNTSTHAQPSGNVRSGETRNIQALGWRPGSVVSRLQFKLDISEEQPERIVAI
jgi:hypothetical protein